MRNSKKWLAGLLSVAMCLTLATAVKQDVRAEEEPQQMEEEAPRPDYVVCTQAAKLYVEPDWKNSEIAASMPENSVLIRIGESGAYTKVNYNGIEGYMDTAYVGYNEEAVAAYEAELAAKSEEVRVMAAMIQCEAGNQPLEGQIAVGAVIMNRVKSEHYPNTIVDVIYQPYQFGPADSQLFANLLANDTIKESCREAARQAFMGVDNVGGALHFRRAGSKEGIVIGNHVFY